LSEKNLVTGEAVSTIAGVGNNFGTTTATETRGDGATRTLNYYSAHQCMDCLPPDSGACPDPSPTDGKLSSYTDFLGHTTTLTYDTTNPSSSGFINSVTDPNNHTTTYTRQTGSWGITQITHPDGSYIMQTYWPNNSQTQPYYLASRTDELGHATNYTRDSNNRITRKDYPTPDPTALDPSPAPVFETLTYNTFNEVLTHRMTNGGTESFTYDTRGLKTSYTDTLGNVTTYAYYTSGPWTDRIQTVTYPLNASTVRATETYDYDRAFDANGENSGNSTAQAPVAGRGLVTRITHADGTYQAFGYDKYANKLWQEDELRHRTTMTYDAYKRVLTISDPLNHIVTNNYVPTGKTSSWITTSSLPFYATLPSTKKTTFYYDGNWRKTRVQQAPGTADEANTYFTYDNLGNLLTTQDPRGNVTTNVYDPRNRLTSTTDALTHATAFTYDAHSNKLTTTKANNEVITNAYDKLNRVIRVSTTRDASTTDVRNMVYDAAGNLIKFQDENATTRSDTVNIYTYTYDLRNRITSMIYPNALHEDTNYDNAGSVVTYKNRAGAVKTFSQFDNRNRSHYFSWNDGVTPWQSTNYDNASRITQIANSVSTINNTYFDDNRLKTQEEWTSAFNDNVHRVVTYAYDVDGNRQTITYPSGAVFNYNYTQRNQVASIADASQHHIVDYTFDTSGNITNRALDNGTSTAYTVDQVNRDTAVAHNLQPTGTTKRFDYAYNSVNDITTVQRDLSLGDGYTYDLTQEILGFAQNGTVNTNGTVTSPDEHEPHLRRVREPNIIIIKWQWRRYVRGGLSQ
jgi:YD repeat-containing protein